MDGDIFWEERDVRVETHEVIPGRIWKEVEGVVAVLLEMGDQLRPDVWHIRAPVMGRGACLGGVRAEEDAMTDGLGVEGNVGSDVRRLKKLDGRSPPGRGRHDGRPRAEEAEDERL